MRKKLLSEIDRNDMDELQRTARNFEKASLSTNSRRSYASDWSDFCFWCKRTNRQPLPATPETVALYLTKMSQHLKVSSLKRRVVAIKKAHLTTKLATPTDDIKVKKTLRGIVISKSEAQKHALPTLLEHMKCMIKALPDTSQGIRDRALLLLGFAGGLRRSEIVGLNVEDLQISDEGLVLHIQKSKTDPTGRGRKIAIKYGNHTETCPIQALSAWLNVVKRSDGHLFSGINKWDQVSPSRLSDQSVYHIIKKSLKRAGLREKDFSGHSLRAGFATVSAMNGASEREIQKTTGHVSLEVLRRYIRDGEIFKNSASGKLGL